LRYDSSIWAKLQSLKPFVCCPDNGFQTWFIRNTRKIILQDVHIWIFISTQKRQNKDNNKSSGCSDFTRTLLIRGGSSLGADGAQPHSNFITLCYQMISFYNILILTLDVPVMISWGIGQV
jgi:hypothetical protein